MLDQALQLNQNKLKPTTINYIYIYTNSYYSTSLSKTLQLKTNLFAKTNSFTKASNPATLRPCAPTRACVAAPWWVAQTALTLLDGGGEGLLSRNRLNLPRPHGREAGWVDGLMDWWIGWWIDEIRWLDNDLDMTSMLRVVDFTRLWWVTWKEWMVFLPRTWTWKCLGIPEVGRSSRIASPKTRPILYPCNPAFAWQLWPRPSTKYIGLKSFLVENLCRKLKGFGRQPVVIWYDFGVPITYLLQLLRLDFGHWRFPTSKAKQLGINRAANPKWGSGLQRERRCISAFLAVFWRLHGYIV